MSRDDALGWMHGGTTLFLKALAEVADDEVSVATKLPGWTRAHLVAHVHYNAEALRRLTTWARTGVETPMYEDLAQRNAEITTGATASVRELRDWVSASSEALTGELANLTDDQWDRRVVTIQGRTIVATEIPWLRAREVFVHAVDLASGPGFEDLPTDFISALIADVGARRTSAGEGGDIAAWLTGRSTTAPSLGAWL